MRVTWLAIAAVALAAQTSQAALTCKFDLQTRVASTLSNPPIASSSDSSDGSGSGSSTSKKKKNSSTSDGSGTGSGASMKDVGNSDDDDDGSGDAGSAGDGAAAGTATPAPGTTTTAPTSTTKAPTTPTTTTTTPTTTTKTPTTTTKAPTTETTAPPAGTSGSSAGTTPAAGGETTKAPASRRRRFLATTTTAPPATTTAASAGDVTEAPTTAPGDVATVAPGVAGSTSGSNSTATNGGSSNSTSGATSGTNVTVVDSFTCDETFYKQWDTLGITCGGASIDVAAAVSAASCVIYSGTLGDVTGTSCVSICSFPACVNNAWSYGASNGIASSVYSSVGISQFYNTTLAAGVSSRLTGSAVLAGNTTLVSNKQCGYSGESSFSSCSCSALLASAANKTDAQIKKQREEDKINGVISEDKTTTVGSVLAPTTQSVAGVTVFVSAVAAVASTAVGSVSAAGASVAAVGANVAVFTIEVCQFGVMINQMNLEGKSAALALFGKQMAPSAFTFLPFGKLNDTDASDSDDSDDSTRRRLTTTDNTSSGRGVASYSRTLGIREDMLFLVTLAGVVVVVAGVLILFGVAYGAAGLFMSREEFLAKFFDKMIGLLVLILILSQYTIGVTGTYQIYYSSQEDNLTDPKCILAILSLLGLAIGIVFYGYVIVKRYEDEIRDVGTVGHMNKKVCHRYGPFYDEYKFKNRFFFASKMMLALVSGVATGYVGMKATYQVSILLAAHVFFFFYLEVQSPHHSKFVQTTTSFVTIMKIATLALTFFLISATTSSDLPTEMQNGISLAIVGLNLFVLFLLMVRSLYAFWKKYQMQRDAKYDENDDQSAAQEYFKDDNTPHNKGGQAAVGGAGAGKSKETNAYVGGGGGNAQYDYQYGENSDDIRLRSATHLQQGSKARGSYEDAPPVRYDQISRNGAQHYIVNNNQHHDPYSAGQYQQQQQYQQSQQQYQQQQPQYANRSQEQFVVTNSREQALHNQRRNDVVEL